LIPLKSGGALTRLHLHSSVAANANLVTAGCWVHSARGTYPSRGGTAEQARTQSRVEQVKHTTIDHLPTSQAIVFYLSITELEACDCAAVDPNLGPVLFWQSPRVDRCGAGGTRSEEETEEDLCGSLP
jgi:hypothetical protein